MRLWEFYLVHPGFERLGFVAAPTSNAAWKEAAGWFPAELLHQLHYREVPPERAETVLLMPDPEITPSVPSEELSLSALLLAVTPSQPSTPWWRP